MKTEKEKVTRNFFVISAILPLCCCHAILSSSVLCLFFFRKAMIHFTLRFFSSCLVCDGRFFFSHFPRQSTLLFRLADFFFQAKLRCLCVLCSYHLEKESRLPSMSPFVFILYYLIHFLVTRGTKQKNNLHLISNSCSYGSLSFVVFFVWLLAGKFSTRKHGRKKRRVNAFLASLKKKVKRNVLETRERRMLVIFCCLSNKDGKKGDGRKWARWSLLIFLFFLGVKSFQKKLLLFFYTHFHWNHYYFVSFIFVCVCCKYSGERKKEELEKCSVFLSGLEERRKKKKKKNGLSAECAHFVCCPCP